MRKLWLGPVLLLMLTAASKAEDTTLKPVIYTHEEIKDLLAGLGRGGRGTKGLLRDSTGSQLRVELSDEFLVFGSDGTLLRVKKPAPTAWMDDSGKIVAWIEGETLRVGDAAIDLEGRRGAGLDQSGRFIFLWDGEGRQTDIREVSDPSKTQITLDGVWRGFGQEGRLAVVKQGEQQRSLRVLILHEDDGRLSVHRSVHVKRKRGAGSPYYVLDLDLASDSIIEVDTVDPPFSFLSSVNVVKLESGERARIARGGWALFLKEDPLASP